MKNIYEILEYNKILNYLSEYAVSEDAKKTCLNLKMLNNKDLLLASLNDTDAAVSYLKGGISPNFLEIRDISKSILRIEKNASLSISELINISKLLDTTYNLVMYKKSKVLDTCLDSYFDALNPLNDINNKIKKIITADNTISDNASTTLQSIRKKKKLLIEKLHAVSNHVLNSYGTYLQESIIVSKDNSLCLPVKSEFKNKIEGTIHSVSESQFTIFIEPKEIIAVNNEISENNSLEEIEISKILYKLSLSLIPYTMIIKNNYTNTIKLDFIFAKAKYAYYNNATYPLLNDEGIIELNDAKHPLINKDAIVPLSINLGKDFTTLIITGPNTGGKTVSLKTVGVIELMALSGLFIPAKENSRVAFFDNIFADIGDEQSIEQSLSTFSSHMTNIVYILQRATDKSLVLFDEICTGTDPIEGASLAISILEYLKSKNTHIIVTTHYPELKQYALSEKNVKNGAFDFNVETLKPTYKLLIGIPGKSNAYAISEKLGLDKNIIEKAKNTLNLNDVRFEDIIASLEENKKALDYEKVEIEKYKMEIEELRNKVKRQEKGLNDRANSIIRQAKIKAHDILCDAKKIADDTIKNIKVSGNDLSSAVSMRTKLNHALNDSANSLVEKHKGPAQPISAKKIKLGANVKVLTLNASGIVETLPDKDYNLFVRIGILRTLVNLRDLELIDNTGIEIDGMKINKSYGNAFSSRIKYEKSILAKNEINLIGKTKDEAISELDKYIDDSYIAHIPSVKIIHGRGTYVLMNAIREYCSKSKVIKSFRPGNFDEGGDGVTIATFKD